MLTPWVAGTALLVALVALGRGEWLRWRQQDLEARQEDYEHVIEAMDRRRP